MKNILKKWYASYLVNRQYRASYIVAEQLVRTNKDFYDYSVEELAERLFNEEKGALTA